MALAIATVADSISKLSVTGVVIKDIDEVRQGADTREGPVLFPDPSGFVTDFTATRESFGPASTAFKDVAYTLNYVLLHSHAGEGRTTTFEQFPDLIAKASAVIDAVLANDTITGCVDITPQDVLDLGVIDDPAGVGYWGCRLAFRVEEYVNA